MASPKSELKNPSSSQESVESIIEIFSRNLVNTFLKPLEQKKDQIKNSDAKDGIEKTKKRHASIDENMETKRKCKVKDDRAHSESHDRMTLEQQNNLENVKKTINMIGKSVEKSCENIHKTTELSDGSKKSTNIDDERVSSKDQLKFGCHFCTERFPSLIAIRDHVWTNHKKASKLRKLGIYTHTSRKEDSKDQQSNLENIKKTIDKNRKSARLLSCENFHKTTELSDASKKTNIDDERVSTKDQLKYGCQDCTERFPSLIAIRNHVRINHKVFYYCNSKQGKYMDNNVHTSQKEDSEVEPKQKEKLPLSEEQETMFLYCCNACKYASISYDCMIQHCQDHIIDNEDPGYCSNSHESKRYMKILGQKYIVDLFTYNVDIREAKVKLIQCNYELLKSDKCPGIFDAFTKPEIDRINGASIYNFTRIIRLSSDDKASFAPFMLYQCMRCMTHVDPYSTVLHVKENSCHEKCNSFPCYDCKRPFFSESAMYLHYKTHKVPDADKKYKTISFNDAKDFYVNSLLLKAAGFEINYAQTGVYPVPQKGSTAHVESVKDKTCPNPVNDARAMIINVTQREANNKMNESTINVNEKVKISDPPVKEREANIYKCRCGLCFHSLESLFKHLDNCHDETILQRCTCTCGLEFDETHFSSHQHSQGFTMFNVKRVVISDEQTIDVRNMLHKIKENETKQNIMKDIRNRVEDCHVSNISGNELKDDEKEVCKETGLDEIQSKASSLATLASKNLEGTEICNTVKTTTVSPEQDDSSDTPTSKRGETSPTVIQTPCKINKEVDQESKTVETVLAPQTKNISYSEPEKQNKIFTELTEVDQYRYSNKSHDRNEKDREAENTTENQLTVDTTMEIELRERSVVEKATEVDFGIVDTSSNSLRYDSDLNENNDAMMKYQDNNTYKEQQKRLDMNTNQVQEIVNARSERNDLSREIIGKSTNEMGQINVDDKIKNIGSVQGTDDKIYTEDELLKDNDGSVYFDVDESLLTDDEDD